LPTANCHRPARRGRDLVPTVVGRSGALFQLANVSDIEQVNY